MSKVLERVNRGLDALEFLDGIESNRTQAVHLPVPPLFLGACTDVANHVSTPRIGVAHEEGKTKA